MRRLILLLALVACKRPAPIVPVDQVCPQIASTYCERIVPACRAMDDCYPAFMAGCHGAAGRVARCESDINAASCASLAAALPASCAALVRR